MKRIRAAYGGRCPACGEGIRVGETIATVGRGQPWIHDRCTVTARQPQLALDAPDDWEAREARSERASMDAEYAAGVEDARRERFNRDTFGEAYAMAEEYARDLRGLNGEW